MTTQGKQPAQAGKAGKAGLECLQAVGKTVDVRKAREISSQEAAAPVNSVDRVTPEDVPDPWLLDTEYLLSDLDRIRELALRIPFTLEATGAINSVVHAVWDLQERLRYCVRLHGDAQRAFRKKVANQFVPVEEQSAAGRKNGKGIEKQAKLRVISGGAR
jgi:hypothetical protein